MESIKTKAYKYMKNNILDHADKNTGIINSISLAESAWLQFNVDPIPDDSVFYIWAEKITEVYERSTGVIAPFPGSTYIGKIINTRESDWF